MQGKTINGFTLQHLLGRGGMAEVWYAENEIGKPAAVKILNNDLAHNAQIVERFRNEAVVMVKLNHPNIRQVYGYGLIDERPSIVMEYLDGSDLKARMKQGQRFTEEELEKWWNQLVSVLNYTHKQGIVHRDIKPSNIFVDKDGDVKLLDFGIAKIRESISMTQTGATMGTLIYMSPEQVDDAKHLGPQSDIYSLAVTFVHLLSGKVPYDTTMSDYKIRKGIVEQPLDLSGIPAVWQGFLLPYLEKDPEDRPALRPFEAVATQASSQTVASDDEGTIVNDTPQKQDSKITKPQNPETKKAESKPVVISEPRDDNKSKRKKGLWIALGLAVVAALAVVFIMVKEKKDAERYGITLNEALIRIEYLFDSGQDFGFDCVTGKELIVESFNGEPTKQLLKKTVIRSIKKLDLHDFGLNEQDMPDVIGFVESIFDCQGYDPSLSYSPSQQNASLNGHDYVDLGLPSGTLWATCNVGASNPEDYGGYFSWGETSTKSTYDWSTYKYANGAFDKMTKYCNSSDTGDNGFADNLTVLQACDDPATVNWGSSWCTPTKEQWEELLNNTTSKWTTQCSKIGYIFVSKNNGQSVYLPAADCRSDIFDVTGNHGYYWSKSLSTHYPNAALILNFGSNYHTMVEYGRCFGFSVRPVCEKPLF